jgi:pyruvate-formate lyase-activating enzyme
MPTLRCLWCTNPPLEEVAVLKWRGDERDRLTVPLCGKHLERLRKAGAKGREHKGWSYKVGWW